MRPAEGAAVAGPRSEGSIPSGAQVRGHSSVTRRSALPSALPTIVSDLRSRIGRAFRHPIRGGRPWPAADASQDISRQLDVIGEEPRLAGSGAAIRCVVTSSEAAGVARSRTRTLTGRKSDLLFSVYANTRVKSPRRRCAKSLADKLGLLIDHLIVGVELLARSYPVDSGHVAKPTCRANKTPGAGASSRRRSTAADAERW